MIIAERTAPSNWRAEKASANLPPDWLVTGDCRNAAEYLAHVAYFDRHGLNPREPRTVGEIRAMLENYPDHRLTPKLSPAQLRDLGQSPFTRTGAPPFSGDWRERFYATLESDSDFASAIGRLIGGVA